MIEEAVKGMLPKTKMGRAMVSKYDLTPGLSYEFGKGQAQMTGKLAAYEDFQEFSSGGNLNRSLANVVSNVAL